MDPADMAIEIKRQCREIASMADSSKAAPALIECLIHLRVARASMENCLFNGRHINNRIPSRGPGGNPAP